MYMRRSLVSSVSIVLAATHVSVMAASATLFPVDLPRAEWVHFRAEGFSEPACGVVYAGGDKVTNGLSLGGVGTGCQVQCLPTPSVSDHRSV